MRFLFRPGLTEAIAEVMRAASPIPAGLGSDLCRVGRTGHPDKFPHGRGNAVRFLIRPGPLDLAEAIAEVMWETCRTPAEGPKGPRPAPDPRREGVS